MCIIVSADKGVEVTVLRSHSCEAEEHNFPIAAFFILNDELYNPRCAPDWYSYACHACRPQSFTQVSSSRTSAREAVYEGDSLLPS